MVIIGNYVLGEKKKKTSGYTTKGAAKRGKYLHGKLVHQICCSIEIYVLLEWGTDFNFLFFIWRPQFFLFASQKYYLYYLCSAKSVDWKRRVQICLLILIMLLTEQMIIVQTASKSSDIVQLLKLCEQVVYGILISIISIIL